MILNFQDIQLIFNALESKIDKNRAAQNLYNFLQNAYSIKRERYPSVSEILSMDKNNDWKNLSAINLNEHRYSNYSTTWFSDIDKDLLQSIIENFKKEKNIDFVYQLQKSILLTSDSRKKMESSKYYINMVVNNKYGIKKPQEKEIFENLVNSQITLYQKDSHKPTLALILKAIENDYPQKKVLLWFKTFLNKNKTINSTAQKEYDTIRKIIKDWDVSEFFSLQEVKDLFSAENGILQKKVSSLYYELDFNQLKNKTKLKISDIHKNVSTLVQSLSEALGNIPEFAGSNANYDENSLKWNIMFEKETKDYYIECINSIIDFTITSKELINKNTMVDKIQKTLFAVKLDKEMENKEISTKRNKI